MRILFTGATSFTGMWFCEALAAAKHDIVATIRREKTAYSDLRARRLKRVAECARPVWNVAFGTPEFLKLIAAEGPFDILCHHAAEVTDYKSADFDAIAAAKSNTLSLRAVLGALRETGCRRIVLTGSVFEAGEGAGNRPLRAVSSYGLSKTITAQIFAFHAEQEDFTLGKFVIPNPFGPFEEPRFTEYLMRCWKDGKTARVGTPAYVRDNIHVSLLAAAYRQVAENLPETGFHRHNPSGYAESQGSFAVRFATEIGKRLQLETPLEMAEQMEFAEPAVRINTDVVAGSKLGWNEKAAWDGLANYYADRFDIALR